MRRIGKWAVSAALLGCLSALAVGETTGQAAQTNLVGAAELWAGMHANGMIDDEQYQHVLENGSLPGGTVVEDSPVAAEAQADWNTLAKEDVITPDELAAMLFDGDIPGLTEEEERALVELAPVYQRKRSKRLTYEVRQKHVRVELMRLGHRLRERRKVFEKRADLLGIPMTNGEGALIEINKQGVPFYSESSGMESCDTVSADEVWPTNAVGHVNTNFNLTGEGVTLAMLEWQGVNEYHQEYVGRVVDKTFMATWSHANAVAAVLVGAGVETYAQGVAPKANLHAYSRKVDPLDTLRAIASGGTVRFSNHSYQTHTTEGHGEYILISYQDVDGWDDTRDDIVYGAYWHLPVWAVGNDRDDDDLELVNKDYDTLNAGIAKNVLSVGAIKSMSNGYTGASNVVMTSFSGWGPTDDGRIKPDLVAGEYAGLAPENGGTTTYDTVTEYRGTSFATPAVTASLGLLQELHDRLHGTNSPLLASTYKALAIHTADEAGGYSGPDYRFGWGVMNTHSAAELMSENAKWNTNPFIKEIMLPSGEYSSFSVEADTNLPLRATICWSDPPYTNLTGGSGPIISTLVNDLDLRIIDPAGQTNFPWVLDPFFDETTDHRGDPATTGDNTRDNVEQVVVTNTVMGVYTVLISHKGTLVNNLAEVDGQEASIVLSGIVPENVDPGIKFAVTSNGVPRIEVPNIIGSVYEIYKTDELLYSGWGDVTNSPLSVLRTNTEWTDPDGSTNDSRFYKIIRDK